MTVPPQTPVCPGSQQRAIAAILSAGILRLDWRQRRIQAAKDEEVSVNSRNCLDECSTIGPPVSTTNTVDSQKGVDQ